MTTRPNKTKGAPKPKKPTRLGHLNELDPDAMTLGDWQRFRGYDPKTARLRDTATTGRAQWCRWHG